MSDLLQFKSQEFMEESVIPSQRAKEPMRADSSGQIARRLAGQVLQSHERRRVVMPIDDRAVARQLPDLRLPCLDVVESFLRIRRVEVIVDFEDPHRWSVLSRHCWSVLRRQRWSVLSRHRWSAHGYWQ